MLKASLLFLILTLSTGLFAQISGNNLFEFQMGNLPDVTPKDLSVHYDQLNLKYRYNSLTAKIRYEQFLSQTDGSSYNRLTQYSLQYRKEGLNIKVGNFSEILGNGLLLRAYEIPGSVFEEQAYRVSYGFYRDLRGASIRYNGKLGYVKAIRGRTLANALPPTLSELDRRPDLTEGVESGINFLGQTAGVVLMRNTNALIKDTFYSLLLSGNIAASLSYNFEYAHSLNSTEPVFALSDDVRYGFYGSVNYSYKSFGISVEYKDYQDMLIGAGISDPPTLVKEHKYKVLNRSIHVPQYYDENGWQAEAYYSFQNGTRLLFNFALAVNEIVTSYTFKEYFTELYFSAGQANNFTLFADYSEEPLKFEDHRYAGGLVWEYAFGRNHSTLFEIEYQRVERNIFSSINFDNIVLIAAYSNSPKTTVSFTWEITSDPILTDPGNFRSWYGVDLSHKLNNRNTISLFAGQRRGGPSCASGVCYEVLDFQGVEFRLKTKF
jgi:hypothetical protein